MDAQLDHKPFHKIGRFGRGRVRPIAFTSRDLAYLHALFTHGSLSSGMLRALVAPDHSQRLTTDRLFLLKNPPNDFIAQPEAQERARNPYGAPLAFEITEYGVCALVDSGRISYDDLVLWRKLHSFFKPQHFDHDLAVGHILGSLELGAREAGIGFISWRDILNRSRCPVETREARNPLAIPYEVSGERHALIPDGLFGLQYPAGACFFALEIDMGTEQHLDSPRKSASLQQKFRAYRTIMREKLYASRFALPSLLLLTVTPSAARMCNMMEHVNRICDHGAKVLTNAFLFRAEPSLTRKSGRKLATDGHMLTTPWERPAHPQLNLANL